MSADRTLIVVLGSNAAKRDELADRLAELTSKIHHIDNNRLNINAELLNAPIKCRNDLIHFAIKKSLMQGKHPVYSGDHTVLFNTQSLKLLADVAVSLGVRLRLLVVYPKKVVHVVEVDKKDVDLREMYYGTRNSDELSEDARYINNSHRLDSVVLADKLIDCADRVMCLPESRDADAVNLSSIVDVANNGCCRMIQHGNFRWIGLLVRVSVIDELRCITLGSSSRSEFQFSLKNFANVLRIYQDSEKISSSIIQIKDVKIVVLNSEEDKSACYSTHVVINPGNHDIKWMKRLAAGYNCWKAYREAQWVAGVDSSLPDKLDRIMDLLMICAGASMLLDNKKCSEKFATIIDKLGKVECVDTLEELLDDTIMSDNIGLDDKDGCTIYYDVSDARVTDCTVEVLDSFGV